MICIRIIRIRRTAATTICSCTTLEAAAHPQETAHTIYTPSIRHHHRTIYATRTNPNSACRVTPGMPTPGNTTSTVTATASHTPTPTRTNTNTNNPNTTRRISRTRRMSSRQRRTVRVLVETETVVAYQRWRLCRRRGVIRSLITTARRRLAPGMRMDRSNRDRVPCSRSAVWLDGVFLAVLNLSILFV